MFEVKLRGRREQTIKARLPYPVADRTHINPQAQAFLCGGGGKVAVGLYRHVLVETRLPGRHGDADIALRSLGLRPVEMSKYCVAVAVLHPGIRRNPWHRTLQRYFADATQGTPGREPNPGSLGLLRVGVPGFEPRTALPPSAAPYHNLPL
jgi:hypothetical protein